MISDWLRPDGFPAALRDFGLTRCSWAGETLCLGLAPNPAHKRLPLEDIPAKPRNVGFFDAPLQTELIRAFVRSSRARNVERLFIGTSHDYAELRAAGYDMTAAIAALKGAKLPKLNDLSLGDMEMIFNGHRLFGTLGDISHIFDVAPSLTRLQLHGHFMLPRPIHHARLEELVVEVDDIGITDGPLDHETVSNLFLSNFPSVQMCSFDFDDTALEVPYGLPGAFLTEGAFPALKALYVNSITPEANEQLDIWRCKRGIMAHWPASQSLTQ